MNDMDIQFVERTQHIINSYKDIYEYTLLLNCTMGLIILPLEVNREKTLEFLNRSLDDIEIIKSIFEKDTAHIFNPTVKNRKTQRFEQAPTTLKTFLYKIRNSLAHFANSTPINENGEWTKIKLVEIEAEVLWGKEISDSLDKLYRNVVKLYMTLQDFLRLNKKVNYYEKDLQLLTKYEEIVYDRGSKNEPDAFTKKINDNIKELEDLIKPYLK